MHFFFKTTHKGLKFCKGPGFVSLVEVNSNITLRNVVYKQCMILKCIMREEDILLFQFQKEQSLGLIGWLSRTMRMGTILSGSSGSEIYVKSVRDPYVKHLGDLHGIHCIQIDFGAVLMFKSPRTNLKKSPG
jgi:hypothetical protein